MKQLLNMTNMSYLEDRGVYPKSKLLKNFFSPFVQPQSYFLDPVAGAGKV